MSYTFNEQGERREIPLYRVTSGIFKPDVFVSHRHTDTSTASRLAARIARNRLEPYVAVFDRSIRGDSVELANKLKEIISASRSLLAIVTTSTQESWWVPFEIGVAHKAGTYLSSYGRRVLLPSFLTAWPNIQTDNGLDTWCQTIHENKNQRRSYSEGMRILRARL